MAIWTCSFHDKSRQTCDVYDFVVLNWIFFICRIFDDLTKRFQDQLKEANLALSASQKEADALREQVTVNPFKKRYST